MTKDQFLKQLNDALRKVSHDEREEIIRDFEEHFVIAYEEGKTDEEIIASLGSPQQIAKEMIASYHIEQMEEKTTTGNIIKATWAVIGLSFFNIVIVLAPFLTIIAFILSGWILSAAGIISPLLVFINPLFYPGTFEMFDLFFSLTLCGLGLFIGIGMYYVTKAISSGFVKYLKFNVNLVKGGLKK